MASCRDPGRAASTARASAQPGGAEVDDVERSADVAVPSMTAAICCMYSNTSRVGSARSR